MSDIIIIGGGPAGLSLACELKRRHIPSLILERAPQLGNTFRTMAANTSYGPWVNGLLVDSSVPWFDLLRRATRERYAQFLSDYAISHDLNYVAGVTVESVLRTGEGFVVKTDHGDYPARYVVNATGYFSNPSIPEYPGLGETAIPYLHAAEYQEPDTIRRRLGKNRGRVLIVGKRLSAGEAMESLHKAGFEVALSHRSPIRFGPSVLVEACLSPLTFLWEELWARIPGAYKPWNLDVKMRGGVQRHLIESGQVACYPDIARFTQNTVVFVDGREESFDIVLFATGYKPALRHLKGLLGENPLKLDGMEAADVPGLFFLGLIGLRTFRSQFLRGIREDSHELAELLATRMTPIMTESVVMA